MYYRTPVQTERNLALALLISALIHLVLLVVLRPTLETEAYRLPAREALPDSIRARYPRFYYLPQELIETPDVVKQKKSDQPAQYLSDKSAEAADRNRNKSLPQGLPYSEGNTAIPVFQGGDGLAPGVESAASAAQMPAAESQESQLADAGKGRRAAPYDGNGSIPWQQARRMSESDSSDANRPASQEYRPFNKNLLQSSGGRGGNRAFANDGQFDNRGSTTSEFGDVTLSTYAWEWAPYIEYMRRRIREHIYPPPAFYQMGAISGQVRLKFQLRRDGSVEGLEALGYIGHVALVQTSLNAIKGSNPFKPLPPDFPESNLDMTWLFYYVIR